MKELAEALTLRGFFVSEQEDHIYFSKGNHDDDLFRLREVFKELGLNVTLTDRKIYLKENECSRESLEKLIWYPARNHEAGGGGGWSSWKYFTKRNHGPKIRTFVLETGVAFLVKSLSTAGITTVLSCDGHWKRAPIIAFSGRQNAIWFQLIYKEIKEKLGLHYEWKVFKNDINFQLQKVDTERWNLAEVLQETYTLGRFFYENAEVLSNLKKEIYGGKLQSTRKFVKQIGYEELEKWMKKKYKDHLKSETLYSILSRAVK